MSTVVDLVVALQELTDHADCLTYSFKPEGYPAGLDCERAAMYINGQDAPAASTFRQIEQRVQSLADELLITSDGRPNYARHRELEIYSREAGIPSRVGPGEQDSFGWLSGIIYTPKGKIVYG